MRVPARERGWSCKLKTKTRISARVARTDCTGLCFILHGRYIWILFMALERGFQISALASGGIENACACITTLWVAVYHCLVL